MEIWEICCVSRADVDAAVLVWRALTGVWLDLFSFVSVYICKCGGEDYIDKSKLDNNRLNESCTL